MHDAGRSFWRPRVLFLPLLSNPAFHRHKLYVDTELHTYTRNKFSIQLCSRIHPSIQPSSYNDSKQSQLNHGHRSTRINPCTSSIKESDRHPSPHPQHSICHRNSRPRRKTMESPMSSSLRRASHQLRLTINIHLPSRSPSFPAPRCPRRTERLAIRSREMGVHRSRSR